MSQWFYAVDGQQHGPVPAETLVRLFDSGHIDAATLIWRDGMPEWQALERHRLSLGIRPASPVPPKADNAASAASAANARSTNTMSSTPYAPPRSLPPADLPPAAPGVVRYAGFIRRLAAWVIDNVLIFGLLMVVAFFSALAARGALGTDDEDALTSVIYLLFYVTVLPLYYGILESSTWQASLGKRAVGIKVCSVNGERLGFPHAVARWIAAALSYLTLYIGFLLAAFTEKKQALHDFVASTLVVDRWAYTAFPERQQAGPSGCLVIGLALLFPLIMVLGIVAAIAIPAYQDYTLRAQVIEAISQTSAAKLSVDEFVASNLSCPRDWTDLRMEQPSSQIVRETNIGETEDGRCLIEIWLHESEGSRRFEDSVVRLHRNGHGSWTCSSDMAQNYLPASCR